MRRQRMSTADLPPLARPRRGVALVTPFLRSGTILRLPVRFLRTPQNDTGKKWMDQTAQIFAHVCTLAKQARLPILSQIVYILDALFQGQRFESNTLKFHT